MIRRKAALKRIDSGSSEGGSSKKLGIFGVFITFEMTKYSFVVSCRGSLSWLLLLLIMIVSCGRSKSEKAEEIISSVSAKHVPDKREGICSISTGDGINGSLLLKGETTSSAALQDMVAALKGAGYQVTDSVQVLPDTVGNPSYMGLVTLSVINLRREPAHSSELVSQAILGTPVMILKEEDGWLLVQTPDRYIAWTEGSSLVRLSPQELREWNNKPRVIFTAMNGWITELPGSDSVTGDIVAGAIVVEDGTEGNMIRILLPDGRKGYLSKSFTREFSSFSDAVGRSGDDIIYEALHFRGLPYLWGGTSPKAVDCSGFVRSVFFMNGLILSRDASLQALQGEPVDISRGYDSLRKGDLLFFGSMGKTGPRVTHVAISKGGAEFIHAASKVMENSFDSTRTDYSPYRKRTLLSARRIPGYDSNGGIINVRRHNWYN
ncbi:MAG: C40 family peptidase [Bacteroidales bacterium]|nr:C40 family peptidase [Bacteroidales bacterium]